MAIKQNNLKHPRTVVRHKIRELIIAASSIPEDKIFLSRPNTAWLSEVPCMLIYYTNDVSEERNNAPLKLNEEVTISTQILCNFDSDNEVDDWLDSRALEIQYALLHTRFLGLEIVESVALVNTVPTTITSEGETDVESVTLNWNIKYIDDLEYTYEPLDEFKSFDSKIENDKGEVLSEDIVTIRE